MRDEPRVHFAEPADGLAVHAARARRGPDAAAGARRALGRQRARRDQRFEVALDVEEVDRALRHAPLLGRRVAVTRGRRGAAAARSLAGAHEAAAGFEDAHAVVLACEIGRSTSIRPPAERRAHHVVLAGDRIQHGDRRRVASRSGKSAASRAECTKLKVIASCQSRATRRRFSVRCRHGRLRIRQHRLHVRGGCGGNRVVAVRAARPPRRNPPRSRGRSGYDGGVTTKSSPSRVNARSEPVEDRGDRPRRHGDAEQPRDARRAHAHRVAARQRPMTSSSGPARPPQMSRISCVARSTASAAAAEIDAALEAIAGVAGEAEPARLALDHRGIPERAFEEHGGRRVADAGMLAAHDAGETERLLLVADQQQVGLEIEHLAVEQRRASRRGARSARRSRRRAADRRTRAAAGPVRASRSW